jgi:transcriptional regulator with XRE-family HTH domain
MRKRPTEPFASQRPVAWYGELIREERVRRGWSQSTLATLAESAQNTISRLECEDCGAQIGTIENILNALGYDLEALPHGQDGVPSRRLLLRRIAQLEREVADLHETVRPRRMAQPRASDALA